MASDRARVTYDPTRQYRAVVMQQGRVTLEADVNEAQYIGEEELRKETFDIVGPQGTPDNGWEVTAAGLFDFHIGPGTMYVDGLRLVEATGFDYSKQPEWLDRDGDPFWVDLAKVRENKSNELVALFLREQEVGAVEDQPQREVALGGPDTGQRRRLVRRVVRFPIHPGDCTGARAELAKTSPQWGAPWDPATLELRSPATLKVHPIDPPPPDSPCDPPVQGGYLGADNQLIRVQISSADLANNTAKLVWGYNNSSFLYRVRAVDSQTLEFEADPVDSYHTPRPNKAVEVLRSAVPLGHENYIAEHTGFVATPLQAYVPETQRLALPVKLPPEFVDLKHTTPLFLRLWEQEITFTPGTPIELPGTGLEVLIDFGGLTGVLSVGQYWMFAVRPSTPINIYPQRYLDAPQPPEGPRMWLCSLAVLAWATGKFGKLDDCRPIFDNLVELTKRRCECCSMVLSPSDVTPSNSLQMALDKMAKSQGTVSLQPGLYELTEPLQLTHDHSRLTLEGCRDGAVIAVKKGFEKAFPEGMVVMQRTDNFTFRRLRFHLPLTPAAGTHNDRVRSVGIRPIHCADLVGEDCLFRFSVQKGIATIGVGIYAGSEMWNPRFSRNRFLHDQDQEVSGSSIHTLVGFALMLEDQSPAPGGGATTRVVPLLDNAVFEENEFSGLTEAVFVRAILGRVRCEENFVRVCEGGFDFSTPDLTVAGQVLRQAFRPKFHDDAERDLYRGLLASLQPEMINLMDELGAAIPLPPIFDASKTVKTVALDKLQQKSVAADAKIVLTNMLSAMREGAGKPAPKTEAPAARADAAAPEEPTSAAAETPDRRKLLDTLNTYRWIITAPVTPRHKLSPAIHFGNNEVRLLPALREARVSPPAIRVLMALNELGTVMLIGNHVTGSTPAALVSIVWPGFCTATGNLFSNASPNEGSFSFVLHSDKRQSLNSIVGNIFRGREQIVPPRSTTAEPTSWGFMNTLG